MVFTPIQNRLKSDFKIVVWGLATRSWAQNVCTLITSLQIEFVKSCWIHFNWNSLSFNSWIISRCFIFSLSNLVWFSKWLTLIREILRPLPSAISWQNRKRSSWRHSWDKQNKIICTDRVSVELSYEANLKWHTRIWGFLLMHFFRPSSSAFW